MRISKQPTDCVFCSDKGDRPLENWCCFRDRNKPFEISAGGCPCGEYVSGFDMGVEEKAAEEPALF